MELNISFEKKAMENEKLKIELQQLREEIKSKKEAKETTEHLNFMKQIEESKQKIVTTNQAKEKLTRNMEEYKKEMDQMKPLQEKCKQL